MDLLDMKSYFRVMLGKKSELAKQCFDGNFIGIDYGIKQDLQQNLLEDRHTFREKFASIYLQVLPVKSKIAAGLAVSSLWTIFKEIQKGDIVLSHNRNGQYRVGEVTGDYYYSSEDFLPHRRPVIWRQDLIDRKSMSIGLKNSAGANGTVINISSYSQEIESLIGTAPASTLMGKDESVKDSAIFALEKHLEDFLVANWDHTEFGKDYEIYEEDGEKIGLRYPTDTGPMDILAIKKDKSELLVVELKRGRAGDAVVGQIMRYMSFVKEELLEENQSVKGAVIALEDDQKVRRALVMIPAVQFYRYEIIFKLVRV